MARLSFHEKKLITELALEILKMEPVESKSRPQWYTDHQQFITNVMRNESKTNALWRHAEEIAMHLILGIEDLRYGYRRRPLYFMGGFRAYFHRLPELTEIKHIPESIEQVNLMAYRIGYYESIIRPKWDNNPNLKE